MAAMHYLRRLFATALITCLLSCAPNYVVFASDIDEEVLLEVCRVRESLVASLRVEWKEDCFEKQGARFNPGDYPSKASLIATVPLPSTDMTYTQSHTFVIDGKRTSHSSVTQIFGEEGTPFEERLRDVYNNGNRTTLSLPSKSRNFPYGRIYAHGDPNQELSLLLLEPVLQCFRLFHIEWNLINHKQYELRNGTSLVNGIACIQFVERNPSQPLVRSFWLDPSRSFLVARFSLMTSNGRIQRQTDFAYKDNAQGIPQLKGWQISKYNLSGDLSTTISAAVTSMDINPSLSEAEFEVDFPFGTLVENLSERQNYIVKERGERRIIQDNEAHIEYATLLRTDAGGAVGLSPKQRRNWMILLNAVIVILIGSTFMLRRKSKS